MTRFQFKQFAINDDRCAMKVGTDGILLGAWANSNTPTRILDIGTGTGLVAMMLAQRFSEAKVDAIEIDRAAYEQAMDNFRVGPFRDRLESIHGCVRAYNTGRRYSLIACNPPWFSDSLKPDTSARSMARHDDTLSSTDLIDVIRNLLADGGTYCTILPIREGKAFIHVANKAGLRCRRCCEVRPNNNKPPKRMLLEFVKNPTKVTTVCESLVVETMRRHEYTPAYRALTRDFYLQG